VVAQEARLQEFKSARKAQRQNVPFRPSACCFLKGCDDHTGVLQHQRVTPGYGGPKLLSALQMFSLQCVGEEVSGPAQMRPLPGRRKWPPARKRPTPSALARVALWGDAGSLEAAAAQCFET